MNPTPTKKYHAVREAIIDFDNNLAYKLTLELADILRALDALPGRTAYAVASDGELLSSGFPHDYDGSDVGEHWDLEHPLDKQPLAVIDFLHSILCKSATE